MSERHQRHGALRGWGAAALGIILNLLLLGYLILNHNGLHSRRAPKDLYRFCI